MSRIKSLDYSHNTNTKEVYSHMIIVDKRLKHEDIKVNDRKVYHWKCKGQKIKDWKVKKIKNKSLRRIQELDSTLV